MSYIVVKFDDLATPPLLFNSKNNHAISHIISEDSLKTIEKYINTKTHVTISVIGMGSAHAYAFTNRDRAIKVYKEIRKYQYDQINRQMKLYVECLGSMINFNPNEIN